MRKRINNFFTLCGLLLTLAALPVFAQNGAEVNKKPLEDFGYSINDKIQKKEVDLNAPFSVELNAILTQEGKLDPKKSKFAKSTGDEQMIEVVKSSFEAIGDSGMLMYLKDLGIENLLITAKQDDKTLSVQFISELPTVNKAKTIGSSLSSIIAIGRQSVKGEDEKTLLNAAWTATADKKVTLNFVMPKETWQEIVFRNLKEFEAKKQKQSASNN